MMSCDAMSVDSGPESEYNFEDLDNKEDGFVPSGRPGSVRRLSRVSLSGIKVGKPPIKVPSNKPILLQGIDPEAIIRNASQLKSEENKLPNLTN
jgi:hypothetical protein